jgi:hypothetical protein
MRLRWTAARMAEAPDYDTAPVISDRLTELGGTPEAHELSDEATQAAATSAA